MSATLIHPEVAIPIPEAHGRRKTITTSKLVDVNSRRERERLSPAALKAFFKIMVYWQVRDEAAKSLLGGITNGPYYEMKKDHDRVLSPDVLTRISYLIGIYKALHVLYGTKLANEWISLPNQNVIFGGNPPLAYMIRGGIPAMQVVRRLLESRQAA